jgi:hypothetical protein
MTLASREIGESLTIAGLFIATAGPIPGQRITQTGKVGRQFRPELKDFAARRVRYPQNMGVQGLPAKGCERFFRFWRQKYRLGAESGSIDRVPHKRMADRRQMDPDLMGPAGLQAAG